MIRRLLRLRCHLFGHRWAYFRFYNDPNLYYCCRDCRQTAVVSVNTQTVRLD